MSHDLLQLIFLYSYVIPVSHVITKLLKLHRVTFKRTIGRNAYKNEMVAYGYMT